MKQFKAICAVLLLACSAAFSQETISISEPSAVGIEENWIVLVPFLQGLITTNFQKYSGMNVVDEQNINTIKEKQKRAENGDYSDVGADLRGQLSNANLTVTGTIMKKAADFALSFNITDMRTGETRASSSLPQCSEAEISSGAAANKISYELMTGFGIVLDAEAKAALTGTSSEMTVEVESQMNRAKGITAEKSGSNIEALKYYIQAQKGDSLNTEVSERIVNVSTVISNSNTFNATGRELIKMRKEWDELLHEAASLLAQNQIQLTLVYYTDVQELEMKDEDYINETSPFAVSAPTLEQIVEYNNGKMVAELQKALHKIPQSKNWGDKINGFPWTYADDFDEDNWLKKAVDGASEKFSFTVQLVNAEKVIAQKEVSYTIRYARNFSDAEIVSSNADKLIFAGVPLADTETSTLSISVVSEDGSAVSVMPASLYEKKTARLREIQRAQRQAEEKEKRKKKNAELKAANSVYYRGTQKSLYLEFLMSPSLVNNTDSAVKLGAGLVGMIEANKWFSFGADLSYLLGSPRKSNPGLNLENGETLYIEEFGEEKDFSMFSANARVEFGYPVFWFYPHVFAGAGFYNASLDGSSKNGLSLEYGVALDYCIRNHGVVGCSYKRFAEIGLGDINVFGIYLGWRF